MSNQARRDWAGQDLWGSSFPFSKIVSFGHVKRFWQLPHYLVADRASECISPSDY
jgi:hypothetical protein